MFSKQPRCSLIAGALLVSVILNLFLVGVLAGAGPTRHKHFGPMMLASEHGDMTGEWLSRYLEPADASSFRDAMQPHMAALKQAHQDVHAATQTLADVFKRDPADPAALQAALDQLAKAKAAVNNEVGAILTDAYGRLSPDGRRRLSELTR